MNKDIFGKFFSKNKKLLIIAVATVVGILLLLAGGGADKTKEQSTPEIDATEQLEQYREALRRDTAV